MRDQIKTNMDVIQNVGDSLQNVADAVNENSVSICC